MKADKSTKRLAHPTVVVVGVAITAALLAVASPVSARRIAADDGNRMGKMEGRDVAKERAHEIGEHSTQRFEGFYVSGETIDSNAASYVELLDVAWRLLSPADPKAELMSLSGVLDPDTNALTEGAQWAGNIWTQNTYGFGLSAVPFLDAAQW